MAQKHCYSKKPITNDKKVTESDVLRMVRLVLFTFNFKGYSSGQSHFSETDAKLAEENEFVTHFVQKCLKTRENEQNVVLNESSEALGNHSEIVRIFGTCHDNS